MSYYRFKVKFEDGDWEEIDIHAETDVKAWAEARQEAKRLYAPQEYTLSLSAKV